MAAPKRAAEARESGAAVRLGAVKAGEGNPASMLVSSLTERCPGMGLRAGNTGNAMNLMRLGAQRPEPT